MGVSDHCYTRSDDLLAIRATGSMSVDHFSATAHFSGINVLTCCIPLSRSQCVCMYNLVACKVCYHVLVVTFPMPHDRGCEIKIIVIVIVIIALL